MSDVFEDLQNATEAAEQAAAGAAQASAIDQARLLLPRLLEPAAAPLALRLSALCEAAGEFELALRLHQCFHQLDVSARALPLHHQLTERAALDARWPQLLASGRPLCLALLEPDRALAPHLLDPVQTQITALLRGQCRTHDLTLAHGGGRLLLVLVDIELAAARNACERVRRVVQAHHWGGLPTVAGLTVSLGLTALRSGEALERLLARAEAGLQTARRDGRNCVRTGVV